MDRERFLSAASCAYKIPAEDGSNFKSEAAFNDGTL